MSTPEPPIIISSTIKPLFSNSRLQLNITSPDLYGGIKVNANPPPPAPVIFECKSYFLVILTILSKELWETPRVASNP